MKYFLNILAAFVLISVNSSLTAQTTLNKGTIKMEITKAKSDDPQMDMGLSALKGSQTELVFDGNRYVTNMDMMGGMVSIKTKIETDKNKMDMLMDAMGNKIWVESELDKAESASEKQVAEQSKITYDKADTKNILGYKCYKMTLTNPEMEDFTLIGYVTQDIKTNANLVKGFQSMQFEGYLMEYTISNPQFSITMSAVEVKDTFDESKFNFDTKGYKKMTMDEFQKSMGGMGGF